MNDIDFGTLLNALRHPYGIRLTSTATDAREFVALSDLYIRIGYTLVVAESHRSGKGPLRVDSTPGVGTMLAIIRSVAKWEHQKHEQWSRSGVRSIATKVAELIDQFRVGGRFSSFRDLRNRFSHGHALPVDDDAAADVTSRLKTLCKDLYDTLLEEFGSTKVQLVPDSIRLTRGRDHDFLELSPLWAISNARDAAPVGLYSHFGSDCVCYIVPGADVVVVRSSGMVEQFRRKFLLERSDNKVIARYVKDFIHDIAAYTEDFSAPSYYFGDDEDSGCVFVPWTRSTSDGNLPRFDVFRIGPDNQHQWRSESSTEWRPYSSFLREISNWKLLARRIRIGLDQFDHQREEEEASRLGSSTRLGIDVPSRLIEVNEDLHTSTSSRPAVDLSSAVDKACEVHKQSTKMFFIVAQAGLGKTRMMINAALRRAAYLEEDPDSPKPLYLFVSSTGRTLASLEDAINGALNITKLLSGHGARALCRNGLLVLLVDGFDELLGSSGYENALGSLEPWFRELGGRGVMVASARSSYYLTQYRRSLSETAGILVDHTCAIIQPWSRSEAEEFLRCAGLPTSAWSGLKQRDWDLLGVPFFAKAFAAWHDVQAGDRYQQLSIFDIVVEQYLRRESAKLTDPHQGPLMTAQELKDLFTEVAEMMQRNRSRELEVNELTTCAQIVIGDDSLESRPGLSRRLTSLCGLDVAMSSEASAKFSFSHEIMFDCFLALALEGCLKAGGIGGFKALLEKGKVHRAALDWLVQQNHKLVRSALQKLMVDSFAGSSSAAALSENLGTLWMSLLGHQRGVPPTTLVRRISLGEVVLASHGWATLVLHECTIESLVLPTTGSFSVRIPSSHVRELRCQSEQMLRSSVSEVDPDRIHAMNLARKYVDTPGQVRAELERLGMVLPRSVSTVSEEAECAEFFLEKITARIDVQVVTFSESQLTDDQRLVWTRRLGDDAWRRFVASLVRHGIAQWEPINASGRSKSRLVFEVPPALVKRRDRSDARVAAFWDGLLDNTGHR